MTQPARGGGAPRVPRVLTIASSDSGGGAGIQADLKAFARCGAHGMSAIVALTAQNTVGVSAIHEVPPDFARAQIDVVLDDLGADAAKTGMLFSAPLIEAVAGALASRGLPLVVDPVMVASSGSRLLREDAVKTLVTALFPLATVVTPNLPEAQALTGLRTEDRAVLAESLAGMGARAVLVTGGHGAFPEDHLFDGSAHLSIPVPRYPVAATHGAGCTHSAALAAGLAAGLSLPGAARQAAAVAADAVAHGLTGLGAGEGPVHALHHWRAPRCPRRTDHCGGERTGAMVAGRPGDQGAARPGRRRPGATSGATSCLCPSASGCSSSPGRSWPATRSSRRSSSRWWPWPSRRSPRSSRTWPAPRTTAARDPGRGYARSSW